MDQVEIVFDKSTAQYDSLNITIDKETVNFEIVDNQIKIVHDIGTGIHRLRLQALGAGDVVFEILEVYVNKAHLRQNLYLSWIDDDNNRIQPATRIWKSGLIWELPFGNPVSFWLVETGDKIANCDYGSNLYEKNVIFYPESVKISDHHPEIAKTYFGSDFRMTVLPKEEINITNVPCQHIDFGHDEQLYEQVKEEILSKLDYATEHQDELPSHKYSFGEIENYNPNDWVIFCLRSYDPTTDTAEYTEHAKEFPLTIKFIESLGINDIHLIHLSIMAPGMLIAPHVDNDRNKVKFGENLQLQIPITKNDGAKFKMSGIGLIPLDEMVLLQNGTYYHSVVNDSGKQRVRLLVKFNPTKNENLFDIDKILKS